MRDERWEKGNSRDATEEICGEKGNSDEEAGSLPPGNVELLGTCALMEQAGD
jgi:hypothetical protein